jgi:hypothetical protein
MELREETKLNKSTNNGAVLKINGRNEREISNSGQQSSLK